MKNFQQLRTEYLRRNPTPEVLEGARQSGRIPKAQMLKFLRKQGIEITERTLNYYISIGLMNPPEVGAKRRGKGKESYFFENDVIKILAIKKFQEQGMTLEEIKNEVIFLNEFTHLLRGGEDENLFEHFSRLSDILVTNLPENVTEESLEKYLGSIETGSDHHRILEWTVIGIRGVEPAKKSLLSKIQNTHGESEETLESLFNSMHKVIWNFKKNILFQQLINRKSRAEAVLIALHTRAIHRIQTIVQFTRAGSDTIYTLGTGFDVFDGPNMLREVEQEIEDPAYVSQLKEDLRRDLNIT